MLFIKYQEEWKDQSLSDSVRFVSCVLKVYTVKTVKLWNGKTTIKTEKSQFCIVHCTQTHFTFKLLVTLFALMSPFYFPVFLVSTVCDKMNDTNWDNKRQFILLWSFKIHSFLAQRNRLLSSKSNFLIIYLCNLMSLSPLIF